MWYGSGKKPVHFISHPGQEIDQFFNIFIFALGVDECLNVVL